MNDELYHFGVKGMKWGVRRDRKSSGGNSRQSSGPRTNYGKNRAYAKEQDRLNKQRWKDTKAQVKSGNLSKKSSEYKREKARYKSYNNMRGNTRGGYGMTKAARGKYMQKLGISANKPVSSLSLSKVAKIEAQTCVKQIAKREVALLAGMAVTYAGVKYMQNRLDFAAADRANKTPRLPKGGSGIINLKPNQYKVY